MGSREWGRTKEVARALAPSESALRASLVAAHGETRIGPAAAAAMRTAIRLAGGREVCFVARVDAAGRVETARVVSRGDVRSVLALPGVAQRGEMLLHNHPSGELDPSDADLEIAARLHDGGIGFGIINNEARELYAVVEIPRSPEHEELDTKGVADELGPAGAVARRLPRYENRPSQQAMAAAIAELYNDGGIGLFEAGTGVGKSLGYLIPALRWAAANGERTIVSTNTINLQEQLVGKDLPFLELALDDQPVRFALLKGWRNYVCLQRLEQASSSGAGLFEKGAAVALESLRAWAERTRDGSLSDLPARPRPELWDEVAAEPDLCGRLKCPHFDRCFLFRARREAAHADVIVVNHHLLLSDLAVRRSQQNWGDAAVLPAYRRLIIDEGHHLEDAAASHLGSTVTRSGLLRLLARLERNGKGLLSVLVQRLSEHPDLINTASLDLVQKRLAPSVRAARQKGTLVFDLLDVVLRDHREPVMRLTERFADHPVWRGGLDAALTDLLGEFALLHDGLRLVRERLESDGVPADAIASLIGEMRGVARRLDVMGDGLRRGLAPSRAPDSEEATVRWMERRGRENNIAVIAVPLDLAPILREDLFKHLETTVLTSATLASKSDFTFLRRRLGLDEPELRPATAIFPSPFNFPGQALLVVPSDLPAPNEDVSAHQRGVVRILSDLAAASDGGIFALFTSHRDLNAAAVELRAAETGHRWPILVQGGDESRDSLLQRFRDSGRAVLLGTASFWEGVDVPGRALRGLVLAKLPFRVPAEPLTAAHCEQIEQRGGDSFREFMLPHAALRLKQGFGRLIRTRTDRGVIVLCDPRVLTKRYGRELLEALPPARRLIAPWHLLIPELERFYATETGSGARWQD